MKRGWVLVSVETIIAIFIALFGSGAGASFFSWLGGRSKRRLSEDEARIAQAVTVTKTALEVSQAQGEQIASLIERVNAQDARIRQLRESQNTLEEENAQLRNRITHLEYSLAAWRHAWRKRLPDEPYPVN